MIRGRAQVFLFMICCGVACNEPGKFTVHFRWDVPRPTQGNMEAVAQVVSPSGSIIQDGPFLLDAASEISLDEVPNGSGLVVIIQIFRAGTSTASLAPLYFGRSVPFDLYANQDTEVAVAIGLTYGPQLVASDGVSPPLVLLNATAGGQLATPELSLQVHAVGATAIEIAQNYHFTDSAQKVDIDETLKKYHLSYNINQGRNCSDRPCDGLRRIFVRAVGHGWRSEPFEKQFELDTSPPTVRNIAFTPENAGNSDIFMTFLTDEPINVDDLSFTWNGPSRPNFQFERNSGTRYEFRHTFDSRIPDGRYDLFSLTVRDLLGHETRVTNSGDAVPSFSVDRTAPTMRLTTVSADKLGLGDILRLEISTDEHLELFEVRSASRLAECSTPAGPGLISCTYAIVAEDIPPNTEQPIPIAVTGRDKAGNVSHLNLTLMGDRRGPHAVAASVRPQAAGADITPTLLILTDEAPAVNVEPTLQWLGSPPDAIYLGDGLFSHTWALSTSRSGGAFELTAASFEDALGNVHTSTFSPTVHLSFDKTLPELALRTIPPDRVKEGDVIDFVMRSSEPCTIAAYVADLTMTCVPDVLVAAPLESRCTALVPTSTNSVEATETFRIHATDIAGNESIFSRGVVFDFSPPSVIPSLTRISYIPSPTNPRPTATSGAIGTQILVSAAVNEPILRANAYLSTGPDSGLRFLPAGGVGSHLVFAATVTATSTEGILPLRLQLQDVVGNMSLLTIGSVAIDRTPPPPLATELIANGLLARVPWGSESSNGLPNLSLTIASNVFSMQDMVVVSTSDGRMLGTAEIMEPTNQTILSLGAVDYANVQVQIADSAGNLSPVSTVRHGLWTATLIGKTPNANFPNPHDGATTPEMLPSRDQIPAGLGRGLGATELNQLARADSVPLTKTSGPLWVQQISASGPAPRSGHGLAAIRFSSPVLFGGTSSQNLADTWRWDPANRTWQERPSGNIPPRVGHAMAANNTSIFLYGGTSNNLASDEIWRLDPGGWIQVGYSGLRPIPRLSTVLTMGPNNILYLFGGNLLYIWQETAWSRPPESLVPPELPSSAGAYDTGRNRLIIYGRNYPPWPISPAHGVWEWDGASWSHPQPTPNPGLRQGHGMTYDPIRQKTILFGGLVAVDAQQTRSAETWAWNGQIWELYDPEISPPAREGGRMAFDGVLNRILLFGGEGATGRLGDTWLLYAGTPNQSPAICFRFSWTAASVSVENITSIRVTSRIGGSAHSPGAEILVWVDDLTEWRSLVSTTNSHLSLSNVSAQSNGADARSWVSNDGNIYFAIRTLSGDDTSAQISADHLELHVGYNVP